MRPARYYVAVAASAMLSAVLGTAATAVLRAAPSLETIYAVRRQVVGCLPLATLVAGLLMYVLCPRPKARAIGRMLFFAAALAILIAVAPETVRLVHG